MYINLRGWGFILTSLPLSYLERRNHFPIGPAAPISRLGGRNSNPPSSIKTFCVQVLLSVTFPGVSPSVELYGQALPMKSCSAILTCCEIKFIFKHSFRIIKLTFIVKETLLSFVTNPLEITFC